MILNDLEGKDKKGEILIDEEEIDPETVRAMIHYIYTGELADGWQDLDIQDVTTAADMYDLPGWMELFNSDSSVAGALGNLAL